jgi:hypothetical protein
MYFAPIALELLPREVRKTAKTRDYLDHHYTPFRALRAPLIKCVNSLKREDIWPILPILAKVEGGALLIFPGIQNMKFFKRGKSPPPSITDFLLNQGIIQPAF